MQSLQQIRSQYLLLASVIQQSLEANNYYEIEAASMLLHVRNDLETVPFRWPDTCWFCRIRILRI